jgi:hypothetical protein
MKDQELGGPGTGLVRLTGTEGSLRRSDRLGWVEDERGCHIWQGQRNKDGYGIVWFNGRKHLVHRLRYEREVGPVPPDMEMDHFFCDNRPCCNTAHVRPVTHRENTLRGNSVAAACAAKTHCPAGHSLSGDNLDPANLRRGQRYCRTCHNATSRAGYHARKVRRAAA